MGSPITWRNVDTPDLRGVSSIFTGAQQAINTGFNKFDSLLKQQEAMDDANWNQVKTNNSNDLQAKLLGITDAEQLKAAKQSLLEEAQSKGAQVDMPTFLKALDSRVPELQNRGLGEVNFKNALTAQEDAPLVDSYQKLVAMGKANSPEAQEVLAKIQRGSGALAQQGVTFQDQRRKTEADITHLQNTDRFNEMKARASLIEAKRVKSDSSTKLLSSLDEARKRLIEDSEFSGGTLDTQKGWDTFVGFVNKNINEGNRQGIIEKFAEQVKNGYTFEYDELDPNGKPTGRKKEVKAQLPVSAAILAASAHKGDVFAPGARAWGDFATYVTNNHKNLTIQKEGIDQFTNNITSAATEAALKRQGK
jgi:hypothetical protein